MPTRTFAPTLALLATLAACSDDSPTELTVSARGAALVAVHQGDTWETLTLDADGRATFQARGPFELVRTCAASRWTVAVAAGPSISSDELRHDCVVLNGTAAVTVRVVGATQTTVVLGTDAAVLQPGQEAILNVDPGTYDLVAYAPASQAMIVRRELVVDGAATITLDFATEAFDLVARPSTGRVGVLQWGHLRTARGSELILPADASLPQLWLPPAAQLAAGDQVFAVAEARSDRGARAKVRIDPAATTPIEVALPEPIETFEPSPLDLGGWSARWTGAGTWEWAIFAINYRVLQPWVFWETRWHLPSRALDPPGQMVMPAFSEIPGWDAAWSMPGNGLSWGISQQRGDLAGEYAMSWGELRTP